MSLTFCTLFSGSSGNAAYLSGDEGGVLVDCGMSCKQVLAAMREAQLDPCSVKALLITHEHSDHVRGAGVVSRQLGIPVYATEGTWNGMERTVGDILPQGRVVITAGESFFLGGFEVAAFSIPHDANDPVGYRFYMRRHSVAVATDLGYFSQTVYDAVSGAEVVLLESNHDPDLLKQNPHYPQPLKSRILGKKGHLSNEAGADAAARLLNAGAKHLLLGHLSKENNTPDMAYRTTHGVLSAEGAVVGRDVSLHVAARHRASFLYRLA